MSMSQAELTALFHGRQNLHAIDFQLREWQDCRLTRDVYLQQAEDEGMVFLGLSGPGHDFVDTWERRSDVKAAPPSRFRIQSVSRPAEGHPATIEVCDGELLWSQVIGDDVIHLRRVGKQRPHHVVWQVLDPVSWVPREHELSLKGEVMHEGRLGLAATGQARRGSRSLEAVLGEWGSRSLSTPTPGSYSSLLTTIARCGLFRAGNYLTLFFTRWQTAVPSSSGHRRRLR